MKKLIIILFNLSFFTTISLSQTWTRIPFNVGSSTGSFTICDGNITVTVTDAFAPANSYGNVNLNPKKDVFGSITFDTSIYIRIENVTSFGSNNGDKWKIVASTGTSWAPFGNSGIPGGTEATSSGTDLHLELQDESTRSGGETINPTSSLTFNKYINGGVVTVYFDNTICDLIALPIELVDFSAYYEDDKFVKLKWLTASERNNDYFTIERSVNGNKWDSIKIINGAGNSSVLLNYTTIDETPFRGISYYRLKQTDFDGQFEYSQIRSVNVEKLGNSIIELYPNPVKNQLILVGNETELKGIKIYSLLGKDVTEFAEVIIVNESKLVLDLSRLNTGMYYIKTKNTTSKVCKQ